MARSVGPRRRFDSRRRHVLAHAVGPRRRPFGRRRRTPAPPPGSLSCYMPNYALPFGDAVPNVRGRCLLGRGEVRFAGDPVAVVVAETEEAAADGLERLASGAEFDPLPALVDPVAAADPAAPLVQPGLAGKSAEASLHAAVKVEEEANDQRPSNVTGRVRFVRGDIERGLRESALVVGRTFRTSVVHQAYIEPHATTAAFDPSSRRLTVWTATQGLFYSRENVAQVLGLPESSVRIIPMAVGGGFGAKILLLEPLAGALAMLLGRPVRVVLTRSDEFRTATPAPQSTLEVRLGARRDGTLVAIQAQLLFDAGALPGAPLNIAALMLGGNYQAPHLDIQGREILTHKAPIGAYRAPGAPQAAFALESVLDDLARGLGLDPIEFRLRNASQGGDPMPSGEPWPRIGLREALQAVQEDPLWRNRERNGRGIGVAAGGWLGGLEPASACIRLNTDGGAQVIVGSVDISGPATDWRRSPPRCSACRCRVSGWSGRTATARPMPGCPAAARSSTPSARRWSKPQRTRGASSSPWPPGGWRRRRRTWKAPAGWWGCAGCRPARSRSRIS